MKEKKFIMVDNNGNLELRFGYVEAHKYLLTKNDIAKHNKCLGGGNWTVNEYTKTIILFGISTDFGKCDESKLMKATENFKKDGDFSEISTVLLYLPAYTEVANDDFTQYSFEIR